MSFFGVKRILYELNRWEGVIDTTAGILPLKKLIIFHEKWKKYYLIKDVLKFCLLSHFRSPTLSVPVIVTLYDRTWLVVDSSPRKPNQKHTWYTSNWDEKLWSCSSGVDIRLWHRRGAAGVEHAEGSSARGRSRRGHPHCQLFVVLCPHPTFFETVEQGCAKNLAVSHFAMLCRCFYPAREHCEKRDRKYLHSHAVDRHHVEWELLEARDVENTLRTSSHPTLPPSDRQKFRVIIVFVIFNA